MLLVLVPVDWHSLHCWTVSGLYSEVYSQHGLQAHLQQAHGDGSLLQGVRALRFEAQGVGLVSEAQDHSGVGSV